jgi:peptidoglycan hydrolase-like protein with peptidoglycan-binding domain
VHRRPTTAAVSLTVLALVLTACSGEVSTPATAQPDAVTAPRPRRAHAGADGAAVASPSASVEPSPTPEATPSVAPTPTAAPSPAAPAYDVVAAQRTLADLGYYLGAADGKRGGAFRSAVMAFQKVQGLGADGVVGPATLKALAAPARPALKASGPSNRVEVDLTKQVLYVVKGGAVSRILPVSSGNGATYAQKDGSTARALTPTGRYTIQRRIVGERKADLGTLYDPQYFYRGWAIHGSNSVAGRTGQPRLRAGDPAPTPSGCSAPSATARRLPLRRQARLLGRQRARPAPTAHRRHGGAAAPLRS